MPPPPNKQPTAPPPPQATPGAAQMVVPPPQQRSVSLPDMTSYAVQAEEEKRQKRLARNRASARLRRLRKKNLVSTKNDVFLLFDHCFEKETHAVLLLC